MSEKASVKLSTKSWHYKLLKFIWGDGAPTPSNMFNLCPYFWLLIGSMMVTPIVVPLKLLFRGFAKTMDGLADLMERLIVIPSAEKWEESLDDLDIYQILQWDKSLQKFYMKLNYKEADTFRAKEKFAYNWWREKYNKKVFQKDSKDQTYGTYTKAFSKWMDSQEEEFDKIMAETSERERLERERKAQQEENLRKFRKGVDKAGDRIKDTVLSWKSFIKWTKRAVGLIVTSVLLVATYFIVNFAGRGILWVVDNWNWEIFFVVLIGLAIAGLFILVIWLVGLWIKYIDNKGVKKVWYTKILYYLAKYLIGAPIKFVFYTFLWKWIISNIWHLIKRGAQLFWGSFLGFLGIFGEYFGASYTDYCPGIEWEENE